MSMMEVTRREVVKNTSHELVSKLLDGPKMGELIYLTWKWATVEEREGSFYFKDETGKEFLKVTIDPEGGINGNRV